MFSEPAEIIGNHSSIHEVRRIVARIARTPARIVMLYGETGTGKSLVGRCIHRLSPRSSERFVEINCAAIPSNLLESELFGYEKGAFTGASQRKIGLIEAAHTGTLFLDEISELDPMLQAKLLGFLDTQSFRRVGGIDPISVDVRYVVATNKMLLSEVSAGRFREDLYYRLQIGFIKIPPLRERGDDVFVLLDYFLKDLSARYKHVITGIDSPVRELFRKYPWPGNVRELAHVIERVFVLSDTKIITLDNLPRRLIDPSFGAVVMHRDQPTSQPNTPVTLNLDDRLAVFEREAISSALTASTGSVSGAADLLGVSRHSIRNRMLRLGMALKK